MGVLLRHLQVLLITIPLAGCASAGSAWVSEQPHERWEGSSSSAKYLDEEKDDEKTRRDLEQAARAEEANRGPEPRRPVIRLGEVDEPRDMDATDSDSGRSVASPEAPAKPAAATKEENASGTTIINNYYGYGSAYGYGSGVGYGSVTSGRYGFGGQASHYPRYAPPRSLPTQRPTPAARSETPPTGGDWPAVRSFGPAFPYRSAPAPTWSR